MNPGFLLPLLRLCWPWWLAGALSGLCLTPLARVIPRKVLERAQAPAPAWQGPGGGLEQPVPQARRIWVPLVNAGLWASAAANSSHPVFLSTLAWAVLESALLLL